jgi:hypothetical protein
MLICAAAAAEEQPQIAYKLLDEYLREEAAAGSDKTGPIIAMAVGGGLLLSGVTLMIFGDDISAALSETGQAWDPTTKWTVSGTLAGTGVLTFGIGTGLLLTEAPDYRERYASIYEETDRAAREAQAAAVLKTLADEARSTRVARGIIGITTPFVTAGITILANLIAGPPRNWYDDVVAVSSWQLINLGTGIMTLATPSKEERLYERYRSARAIYAGKD